MKAITTTALTELITLIKNNFISSTDAVELTEVTIDTTPTASSSNLITSGGVKTALDGKANSSHTHNDIYYTETEIDTALNGKANLSGAAFTGNVNVKNGSGTNVATMDTNGYVTGTWLRTTSATNLNSAAPNVAVLSNGWIYSRTPAQLLSDMGGASSSHTHDDIYYTETEIDTALNNKISTSEKGSSGGVAELDENGIILSTQLPSYVDDVLEYTSHSNFPATGESGKIYIATDTNMTYRWGGSAYVEITSSIALGETSSTAYRGDRGKTAYDHSQDGTVHVTASDKTAWNNKADISDIPTKTSDITNDSNFVSATIENATEVSIDTVVTQGSSNLITSGAVKTAVDAKADTSHTHNSYLTDAPSDSKSYGRKNGAWAEITGGGAVDSVNGKTGTVVLDAEDVGALPDDTVIPSKTSDLTNDSGFLTSHQSLADYSTTTQMNTAIANHHDSAKQNLVSVGTQTPQNPSNGDIWIDTNDGTTDIPTDYIVDQGTSGIWTYRKWNSGIAECWGTHIIPAGVTITNAWGNIYESNRQFGGISYPFTFSSTPVENLTLSSASASVWVEPGGASGSENTATTSSKFYLLRGTTNSSTGGAIYVHITVKGRWK